MSTPSSRTDPSATSQNLGRRLTRVVFPAPEGPTTATTSPGRSRSDTSRSAHGVSGWSRYRKETRSNSTVPRTGRGRATGSAGSAIGVSASRSWKTRSAAPTDSW